MFPSGRGIKAWYADPAALSVFSHRIISRRYMIFPGSSLARLLKKSQKKFDSRLFPVFFLQDGLDKKMGKQYIISICTSERDRVRIAPAWSRSNPPRPAEGDNT